MKPVRLDDLPLFADDKSLGAAVLGPERAGEFHAFATLLERNGFPKIDLRWGGRYVPAVKAWFDHDYGLIPNKPQASNGIERPDAWNRRRTGT
jgi:hypothetical protein